MSGPVLVGLCGALRRDSTNRKLLHEAARLFGPCRFIDADLHLPLYDGDAEEADGAPAAVHKLAEQIAAADAVLISTPEYNKGLSGVLKNALDWISRIEGNPWRDKPVAVMSAAAGRAGGERAQAMHLAGSSQAFDAQNHLTSEVYLATLQELMDGLRSDI